MATYASTTNPFINPNPPSNGLERPTKKDAPGMAKLQSSAKMECFKIENDLLLSNEETQAPKNILHELYDVEKSPEKASNCCKTISKNNLDHIESELLCSEDSLEIMRIGKDLIDSVVKLELEESSNQKAVQTLDKKLEICEESKEYDYEDEDSEVEVEQYIESPSMEQANRRNQHLELIKKLRLQLRDLERYAHERGELDQVPPSVLAERQSVIIDTIKDRLSLNIGADEIEKLELDELKKQVDNEIRDLIDPLVTKEHLLGQLKTQLTDLERYIAHLHGTIGKIHDKKSCLCHLHGCSQSTNKEISRDFNLSSASNHFLKDSSLLNNNSLPKTSRLIRSLVTQLICSDIKLQESAKKERAYEELTSKNSDYNINSKNNPSVLKIPNFHDNAAWSLHLDKVVLATDSLVNLFTAEPRHRLTDKSLDENLVKSVVRRQLVPAIRDLLSYGLIDPSSLPQSTSYVSILFNPYYILSSLTCFPSSQKTAMSLTDKIHVWNVIEEYYETRNEPEFKTSSIKTLSQSFDLAPSISGPIKITSKQALLIAVDDIIKTLSECKPNGPESHFSAFIYTALNRSKLTTWLRLVFKNKSVIRKFYHNFSFVSQPDKMDKLLATIEPLSHFEFKLHTDVESTEQFVNAF